MLDLAKNLAGIDASIASRIEAGKDTRALVLVGDLMAMELETDLAKRNIVFKKRSKSRCEND